MAESQLSLMAWRSAVILNDVLGRRRFAVERERDLIRWQTRSHTDEACSDGTAEDLRHALP